MLKRGVDLLGAVAGLVVLSPVLLAISILVKSSSPGPVFFRQERVGQFGKIFRIYKFRTMVENAESLGAQVSSGDDPRITAVGRILRKYKLDELPQLLNVAAGDMSLVGPRPEVARYVAAFADDYEFILQVRPGITDYAAIEYRDENELLSAASDPEEVYLREILPKKIEYYKEYIREQNVFLDLKLIFLTIWRLIR